jgi:lipoate-protein ligase A
VIDTDLNHPYYVTAADEALAIGCGKYGAENTLHLYRRKPPAISVGYFRKVDEDIDLQACEDLGITVVRRTSGGGSIYTDPDQLIFSLITNQPLGDDVEHSFRVVCLALIEALKMCEIPATFKPPNDVLVNDKKVSGAAQVKKRNAYLTHATIILDLDNKIIERVLKNAKLGYTSSIQKECGFTPEVGELKLALQNAFQEQLGIKFENGKFSEIEKKCIQELIENKYSSDAWNFKR